jgi:hypothetical protein
MIDGFAIGALLVGALILLVVLKFTGIAIWGVGAK